MMRDYLFNINIDEMSKNSLQNIINNELNFRDIVKKTTLSREKIFPVDNKKLHFNEIVQGIYNKENKI